jgi:indolepyruvate ferredoxin oxidoreductase alpha subunit
MGASIGVLHGMSVAGMPEHAVATIGDSTLFHSGLPALANMVHNGSRGVVIVMDNGTTAMTGHQDHPGTAWTLARDSAPQIPIEPLVRALGVKKVLRVDAFDMDAVKQGLNECLDFDGPSVLITEGPCAQVSKPDLAEYAVDPELCVACGTCFGLGCPAIVKSGSEVAQNGKAKAEIDRTLCVGCDMCRQVCPTSAIKRPGEEVN